MTIRHRFYEETGTTAPLKARCSRRQLDGMLDDYYAQRGG